MPPRVGGRIEPIRLHAVAQPARRQQRPESAPLVDPAAVSRAYRLERAKRQARADRERARQAARLRFWTALVLLTAMLALLALTVWNEIERLFGL